MVLHTLDAMVRVQVLVKSKLENRCTALAEERVNMTPTHVKHQHAPASDNTPCKEECPNSEPTFAILSPHSFLVRHPVFVPPVQSGRVVNPKHVDILDFKAGGLKLSEHELMWFATAASIHIPGLQPIRGNN